MAAYPAGALCGRTPFAPPGVPRGLGTRYASTWTAGRLPPRLATTRTCVAAILLGPRETASRAPDCAASLRRAIPTCVKARAESRVQSGALDAVSMAPEPRALKSATPGNPRGRSAPARQPNAVGSGKSESRRRGAAADCSSGESRAAATIRVLQRNIDGRAERIGADHRFAQASRANGGADAVRPYSAAARCRPRLLQPQ